LWPGGPFFGMDEHGGGTNLGNVYSNSMLGTNLPTSLGAPASQTPMQQAGSMQQGGAMQGQQSGQQLGASAANAAATGSSYMATSSPGAAQAQNETSGQQSNLEQAAQRNADFINNTMQRLAPNASKRG
jgi:hypothetical protein